MNKSSWFSQISFKQRLWLFSTLAGIIVLMVLGISLDLSGGSSKTISFNLNMSIQDIAPKLGVTGKALARELYLRLDTPKNKPLHSLGITEKTLRHTVKHLGMNRDSTPKYFVYLALFLWGLIFLVRLGRPDKSDPKNYRTWYPRAPYIIALIFSVIVAGFLLGKAPNPMEGVVKVFKSMIGLYPDPVIKILAFAFFILLAIIGNKIICGWACPFGALQELIYSLPFFRKVKKHKLPFKVTNTIRAVLFIIVLLFMFGIIGGSKGLIIYHYINPFNLFNLDFETLSILLTLVLFLLLAFFIYRPFCQLICPFGLISWLAERLSIFRVQIDHEKCTECGACIKACPLEAAAGRVKGNKMPADCFSCARCLNVCPVDAIQYSASLKKAITETTS
jgi:polyferredoxin